MNNFQETAFTDSEGEAIIASSVDLGEPAYGVARLAKLAARPIAECFMAAAGEDPSRIPVILCLAEPDRAGLPDDLHDLPREMERVLEMSLHPASSVLQQGRVGAAVALLQARRLLRDGRCARVIVAGTDSFVADATVAAYEKDRRLLTRSNSNGFIPGEAGSAILVGGWEPEQASALAVRGLGFAREPAPFGSSKPLRAEGLVQAISGALSEAGIALHDCDHRIADCNGELYRFKETSLAMMRLLRERKSQFGLWHPGDCIGDVGSAMLPAMMAILYFGAVKSYLPGPVFLGHVGNDDDKRAAFVAHATTSQPLALEAAAQSAYAIKRRSTVL
jgi:3-oxoacyl-[acyl-carrier-protein] synthase-1